MELKPRTFTSSHWFRCDNALIDTYGAQIGGMAIAVYAALARYASSKTGKCFPSTVRLGKQLGANRLTVRRGMQRLQDAGLIHIEDRPGHTMMVTLLALPQSMQPTTRQEEDISDPQALLTTFKRYDPLTQPPDPKDLRSLPYEEYLLTHHWQAIRRVALRRAKQKCQLCHSAHLLHAHHNNYDHRGEEQAHMEDILILCAPCHTKHHEKDTSQSLLHT